MRFTFEIIYEKIDFEICFEKIKKRVWPSLLSCYKFKMKFPYHSSIQILQWELSALKRTNWKENDSINTNIWFCWKHFVECNEQAFFFIQISSRTNELQICLKMCRFRKRTRPIMYWYWTVQDGCIQWIYLYVVPGSTVFWRAEHEYMLCVVYEQPQCIGLYFSKVI